MHEEDENNNIIQQQNLREYEAYPKLRDATAKAAAAQEQQKHKD
jgi:hypothetical protein